MRPSRALLACLVTLLFLIGIISFRRSHGRLGGSVTGEGSRRSRLRALFSFHTPDSLFPPSAIISLTDDNSTFFLARPAAYGPSLPSHGLSGQLWIGSGFTDDNSVPAGATINAEGELGCSDIPGWPYTGSQDAGHAESTKSNKIKSGSDATANKKSAKVPARAIPADQTGRDGKKPLSAPHVNEGTDDYLHWPLKGAPLIKGTKVPESSQDNSKDGTDKEHGDIQSLQESAEIAGKVVLLSRGGCGFLEKTKWVQRRGGVALIVGDNIRGGPLLAMYASGDTSNVTIPSIFTSHMSAHLLSSLMPPGGFINGVPVPEDLTNSKTGGGGGGGGSSSSNKKPLKKPAKTEGRPPANKQGATSSAASGQNKDKNGSWFARLANALGIRSNGGTPDSRRFPNSGRISWVQSDNWDEDIQPKQTQDTKQQDPKSGNGASKDGQSGSRTPGGFVIGVHDWRDPDLVDLQQAADNTITTRKTGPTTTSSSLYSDGKPTTDAKAKPFTGGNVVPGSGRYSLPGQTNDQSKAVDASEETSQDQSKGSWLGKLLGSDGDPISEEEALEQSKLNAAAAMNVEAHQLPPLIDTPMPREGLWVTITPTTMSTSPFFDTLLVLVVSPLVTLTVVYALLLLRARIQRRRWRAPKSVVERLPVRVYQTMSSSTSTSSHTPSVETSSAASPLLQPEQGASLSRTRPRSRTTTSIHESPALTLERQREDLASRYEKKKYRGRQIECVVCLEEYVDGQSQVMSLPCGHEFHAECITPWLTTRRRTCPICKGDVVRSLASSSNCRTPEARSPVRSSHHASRSPIRSQSSSRSESRGSRTPLLGHHRDDLERGRSGSSASPDRSAWRSLAWSNWWIRGRGEGQSAEADRDR